MHLEKQMLCRSYFGADLILRLRMICILRYLNNSDVIKHGHLKHLLYDEPDGALTAKAGKTKK